MWNVEGQMTGQLLMLFTAVATGGFGAIAVANLLSRRVRIAVRDTHRSDERTFSS